MSSGKRLIRFYIVLLSSSPVKKGVAAHQGIEDSSGTLDFCLDLRIRMAIANAVVVAQKR
jgi:hypothetical protein